MKNEAFILAPGNRYGPSHDPNEFSKVRRQENTQHADSQRPGDRDESSGSAGTRKLVPAVSTKTEFQNMKITNHQCLFDDSVPIFAKEIGNHNGSLNICNGSNDDQCIDMVIVHVFVNESSHTI